MTVLGLTDWVFNFLCTVSVHVSGLNNKLQYSAGPMLYAGDLLWVSDVLFKLILVVPWSLK